VKALYVFIESPSQKLSSLAPFHRRRHLSLSEEEAEGGRRERTEGRRGKGNQPKKMRPSRKEENTLRGSNT